MKLTSKERSVLALTVFSMFFGAGNLIFPPYLASASGNSFLPALVGFYITAIGLPILALIAVERADGLDALSSRIHPVFGLIYTSAIYLAIGPCLAIPRTASTSYEMVEAALALSGSLPRIAYSLIFFAASSIIALRPEKLTKTLGRITCPMLLILIAVLAIGAACTGRGDTVPEAQASYASAPFATGFNEGYQTMDAIAALVFGMVVAMNIREMGVTERKELQRTEVIAGLSAAAIFIVAYTAIAFTGRIAATHGVSADNGADILSYASGLIFGAPGQIVLAVIFIAACFNTCTGLLSSCGVYFSKLFPGIGCKAWIFIFAAIAFMISNIGLSEIIRISSPVLTLLYPVAIILVLLAFVKDGRNRKWLYSLTVYTALFFSLFSMIFPEQSMYLPLAGQGLSWVIPSLLAAAAGIAIDRRKQINA